MQTVSDSDIVPVRDFSKKKAMDDNKSMQNNTACNEFKAFPSRYMVTHSIATPGNMIKVKNAPRSRIGW